MLGKRIRKSTQTNLQQINKTKKYIQLKKFIWKKWSCNCKKFKNPINISTKNWSHMKNKSHNNIYTIIKNKNN